LSEIAREIVREVALTMFRRSFRPQRAPGGMAASALSIRLAKTRNSSARAHDEFSGSSLIETILLKLSFRRFRFVHLGCRYKKQFASH
jgi:hypothetical protein